MSITFNFVGRAAVVTGGAQGIGRAVVEKLLGGGASVAIWDRDRALAETTASELAGRGKVVAVGVDVGDYAAVEKARDETIAALGKVDILVNSAGIAGPIAKTWEHTPEAMGPGAPRQPHRAVPLLQGAGPRHDRAELRPHRQHRLDRRQGGQPQRLGLFGLEGRRHRPHQVARQGTRHLRHRGQRHHAGGGQDRHPRHR